MQAVDLLRWFSATQTRGENDREKMIPNILGPTQYVGKVYWEWKRERRAGYVNGDRTSATSKLLLLSFPDREITVRYRLAPARPFRGKSSRCNQRVNGCSTYNRCLTPWLLNCVSSAEQRAPRS